MLSSSALREFATEASGEALPATAARVLARVPAHVTAHVPTISLEQYYSEAGPDYAAWSREFNMHFGYYRAGANPLHREAMLEQMNAEVLARLRLDGIAEPKLLDLGCGLGATLRSFARRSTEREAVRSHPGSVASGTRTFPERSSRLRRPR